MNQTQNPSSVAAPYIPISWGELIDKLTILEIKNERMTDAASVANVRKELLFLREIAEPVLASDDVTKKLAVRLKSLNETLWDVEERIRIKETAVQFDEEFIELARSVYRRNDERGILKREINLRLNSDLMEEKSYGRPPA